MSGQAGRERIPPCCSRGSSAASCRRQSPARAYFGAPDGRRHRFCHAGHGHVAKAIVLVIGVGAGFEISGLAVTAVSAQQLPRVGGEHHGPNVLADVRLEVRVGAADVNGCAFAVQLDDVARRAADAGTDVPRGARRSRMRTSRPTRSTRTSSTRSRGAHSQRRCQAARARLTQRQHQAADDDPGCQRPEKPCRRRIDRRCNRGLMRRLYRPGNGLVTRYEEPGIARSPPPGTRRDAGRAAAIRLPSAFAASSPCSPPSFPPVPSVPRAKSTCAPP